MASCWPVRLGGASRAGCVLDKGVERSTCLKQLALTVSWEGMIPTEQAILAAIACVRPLCAPCSLQVLRARLCSYCPAAAGASAGRRCPTTPVRLCPALPRWYPGHSFACIRLSITGSVTQSPTYSDMLISAAGLMDSCTTLRLGPPPPSAGLLRLPEIVASSAQHAQQVEVTRGCSVFVDQPVEHQRAPAAAAGPSPVAAGVPSLI